VSGDALRVAGAPRIVELVGLPGSGKSTLATAVLTGPGPRPLAPDRVLGTPRLPLGTTADRALRGLTDRLPARASGALRGLLWRDGAPDALATLGRTHPDFLALVAHAPPPPDADAEQVLRWRSWPAATIEAHVLLRRAHAPGATVLVEEGLVMRANTVCAGDESLVEPYLTSQPLPDVLLALRVDPALALERIRSRPKRTLLRHEGRSDAEVLRDLERTARLVDAAVRVLAARGALVHELDATEPVETLRRRVVALVDPLLDPRAAQGPEPGPTLDPE